jgi:serine/threonine-protein kinase RsbT
VRRDAPVPAGAVTIDKRIEVRAEPDVFAAQREARAIGAIIGLTPADVTLVATAVAEVAKNILQRAGSGEVRLTTETRGERTGLVVVAQDSGPGIPDIQLALQDGYSSGGGMGLGLTSARRAMDEFEIVSTAARGTTITMKRWVRR